MRNKILSISLILIFVFGGYCHAKSIFPKHNKGKIVSNACIMSYTDVLGKKVKVIKGNSLEVNLSGI